LKCFTNNYHEESADLTVKKNILLSSRDILWMKMIQIRIDAT
jgi:hypothetical protein